MPPSRMSGRLLPTGGAPACASSPARARAHRIAAPHGRRDAPDRDRVREAAFNLIGPVDGASVLDLFAGSGAMGLEALSRGAERASSSSPTAKACRTIDAEPRQAAADRRPRCSARTCGGSLAARARGPTT